MPRYTRLKHHWETQYRLYKLARSKEDIKIQVYPIGIMSTNIIVSNKNWVGFLLWFIKKKNHLYQMPFITLYIM